VVVDTYIYMYPVVCSKYIPGYTYCLAGSKFDSSYSVLKDLHPPIQGIQTGSVSFYNIKNSVFLHLPIFLFVPWLQQLVSISFLPYLKDQGQPGSATERAESYRNSSDQAYG
jgi:hypothetical protein